MYNVQVTTDGEHCLPIDYKVTNSNDNKAMGNMLRRAKSILRTNEFTALYDKGYHTGSELETGQKFGIETLVAIPEVPGNSHAPNPEYDIEHFIYCEEKDIYTCPRGRSLKRMGTGMKRRACGSSNTKPGHVAIVRLRRNAQLPKSMAG